MKGAWLAGALALTAIWIFSAPAHANLADSQVWIEAGRDCKTTLTFTHGIMEFDQVSVNSNPVCVGMQRVVHMEAGPCDTPDGGYPRYECEVGQGPFAGTLIDITTSGAYTLGFPVYWAGQANPVF